MSTVTIDRIALLHYRGDQCLHQVRAAPNPVAVGDALAQAFADWGATTLETDKFTMLAPVADFTNTPVVKVPAGNYMGTATMPRWITRTEIDAIPGIKPRGTTGLLLPLANVTFTNMGFVGECRDPNEDSGIFSWNADGKAGVRFTNCLLDASKNCDWGALYNWTPGRKTAYFDRSLIKHCRFGIAMADGGGDGQSLFVDKCNFMGDANGSHTFGDSSGIDSENGGALAGVLIRGGMTSVLDTSFDLTGLDAEYDPRGVDGVPLKYGCRRMTAITDRYFTASQDDIDIRLERIRVKLNRRPATPVAKDTLIHYRPPVIIYDEVAIAKIRGGSNPDGTLSFWQPTGDPGI